MHIYARYLPVNFKVPGCAHLAGLPKDAYGEDGCYRWIAMQLLGRTLADGLEAAGGRIGWPTVAAVAVQAVAALRYVHAKGFVYVDVNPGNLMCGRAEDGLADTLFLCDFGLTGAVLLLLLPDCLAAAATLPYPDLLPSHSDYRGLARRRGQGGDREWHAALCFRGWPHGIS